MIIKNNKPIGRWLFYKVGGIARKTWIAAYSQANVPITSESQIIYNGHDKALRNYEDRTGRNLGNTWTVPSDPEFETFVGSGFTTGIYGGTITPLGAVNVKEGENQLFTMVASAITLQVSATTSGITTGGTITPSSTGNTTSTYALTALTNNWVTVFADVAGDISGTSTYTAIDVLSATTVRSTFSSISAATTFTFAMSATTGHYLSGLTLNGADVTGDATGNLSGSSAYIASGITDNTTEVVAVFGVT